MNGRVLTAIMVVGAWLVVAGWSGSLWAADQPVAATQAQPAAAAPAAAAPVEPPKTQVDDVRAQLSGTTWTLELTPVGGGKPANDSVGFEGRKIGSERLMKGGYQKSNYTLRIEGEVPVIETMQAKEDGSAAFWRWEFSGSMAQGVMTEQDAKGEAKQYAFTAKESAGKVITLNPTLPVDQHALKAAQAGGESASAAGAASSEEAPAKAPVKKEKRGWFW